MTVVLADTEALLCVVLRHFEALALRQYEALAPELVTDEKRSLVARLQRLAPDDGPLIASDLESRVAALLLALTSDDKKAVLINQGFLLEFVGKAIYEGVLSRDRISDSMRELCVAGAAAGEKTRAAVLDVLRAEFPSGEDFLAALVDTSKDVLKQLDPLSVGLDTNFGEAFGLRFGDLIGDFVAEIDDAAGSLGADRRKLVGFLTHVMMEM